VKQLVGSTVRDRDAAGTVTNFETNLPPEHFAALYRADGLAGGHVIMIGPGNREAALRALRAYPGGMQAGGGITPDTAAEYLDAGASHVIVTSYVFTNGEVVWEHLAALRRAVGKKRLVLDISCIGRDDGYYVVTDRWQKVSTYRISRDSLERLSGYCDEFLVHAAEREGKREGIDEALVVLLGSASTVPVTYAGGIRSMDDLERVRQLGQERCDATVGSALDIFGGTLPYREVVRWNNTNVQ
jgi:phosphoribosylformimino-5-aminoimidazole carboxamide ribotide isomerase